MDHSVILPRLENFEGRVPYMYRCTGGEVTIGIGHAILTPELAQKLTWTVAGRPATPTEIRADYARIAAEPKGMAAKHYEPLTVCRMNDEAIDELASSDIDTFAGQVAAVVPKFNTYPTCVQAALFDMAFNLGIAGLQRFHHLLTACDAADWETAANQCHRQGIGEPRNVETAALFRQALKET
jgi:GH24 family phage-related lysozyme (muramidase)